MQIMMPHQTNEKPCCFQFYMQFSTTDEVCPYCYSWTLEWGENLYCWGAGHERGRKGLWWLYVKSPYVAYDYFHLDNTNCFLLLGIGFGSLKLRANLKFSPVMLARPIHVTGQRFMPKFRKVALPNLSCLMGASENILLTNTEVCRSQTRGVNFCSKLGKRKTVKSVAKRFKRLGSGMLKRWRAGKNHNMRKKSTNQKRRLKRPVIVKGKQLRKLNKMISGWWMRLFDRFP